MNLKKNALITGGGKGIGREIAIRYLEHGYRVFIFYPRPEDLSSDLHKDLRENAVLVDFSQPENIYAGFDQIKKFTSTLDVLVNNSGVYPRKAMSDITLEDWHSVININLTAAFFCSQQAANLMPIERTTYITNIGSDAALIGPKRGVHYAASKSGLVGLTKSMANALADRKINVNVILPGVVDTDQPMLTPQKRVSHALEIPLGRVASTLDIAKVVTTLSSGDMDYVTGQKIVIDGGRNSI